MLSRPSCHAVCLAFEVVLSCCHALKVVLLSCCQGRAVMLSCCQGRAVMLSCCHAVKVVLSCCQGHAVMLSVMLSRLCCHAVMPTGFCFEKCLMLPDDLRLLQTCVLLCFGLRSTCCYPTATILLGAATLLLLCLVLLSVRPDD